ncbi:hypothetical protein [Kribbella sp. VKM Ac-2568]|uniref:hypothetical protein n=1 Tax=Kribbella sp. VKM Ac-2568 TaxID=2512219 RepID=UPI001052F6AF|nr:hypothetical protein [Kribbella sp. VKM Ac-2568]
MFDAPVVLDHGGWVEAARSAAAQISPREVEDAFVSSLTSRRLDLRSALASFLIARALPDHHFTAMRSGRMCAVCGLYSGSAPEDLNVLNFERFKWGGIRRDDITYVAFDLQQFIRAPRREVTPDDRKLGSAVLEILRGLPTETTVAQAPSHLGLLKGNKPERSVLMDILGICGVLDTADHRGYAEGFVRFGDRELPPYRFVDRAYPACWWQASTGINFRAVKNVLPTLS